MKNKILLPYSALCVLVSILVSCSPTGRLVMVKAHPTKEVVTMSSSKSRHYIKPIESKKVADIRDNKDQKSLSNNVEQKSALTSNVYVKHSPLKKAMPIAAIQNIAKHINNKMGSTIVKAQKPVLGQAHDGNGGLGGALALMIIGVLLTLFFAVPTFGYYIGIVGIILFIIGVIDLVMWLV